MRWRKIFTCPRSSLLQVRSYGFNPLNLTGIMILSTDSNLQHSIHLLHIGYGSNGHSFFKVTELGKISSHVQHPAVAPLQVLRGWNPPEFHQVPCDDKRHRNLNGPHKVEFRRELPFVLCYMLHSFYGTWKDEGSNILQLTIQPSI